MKGDKLIIDWSDEEHAETGFDELICELKERCKLEGAEYVVLKIVSDFGYRRYTDAHTPNIRTRFDITDDLYDYLNDLVDGEDCKNGTQLYQEDDGTYYFQITGSNFYDKENNYAGTDTVKVYMKEFKWTH